MYIMSKMASSQETVSEIHHYERLEFLGDAVIEFLSRSVGHFSSILSVFRCCRPFSMSSCPLGALLISDVGLELLGILIELLLLQHSIV